MEDVPRVRSVNTRQGRKSRPDISDFEAVGLFNDVISEAQFLHR